MVSLDCVRRDLRILLSHQPVYLYILIFCRIPAITGFLRHYIPARFPQLPENNFFTYLFDYIWDVVVVELLPGANPEAAKATVVAVQADATG